MVTLYRPSEQLQKLATAAIIPYSEAQKLEIGLTLIHNTRYFEKALGEQNTRAVTTNTWDTFKVHFKDAQTKLKEIRGPIMQQAGYHHANMLAEQLCADLRLQGIEMLALVQSMANIDNNPPVYEAQHRPQPPPVPVANAVMKDAVQVEIIHLLRDIAHQNGNNRQRGRDGQEGWGGQGGGTNRNHRTP